MDQAYQFFIKGNFAAAFELLPATDSVLSSCYAQIVSETVSIVRPLADYYCKWDRLDYKGAVNVTIPQNNCSEQIASKWSRVLVNERMKGWVNELGKTLPSDYKMKAKRLRYIAIDLFANGERRLRDSHYEDAVLRAYRVFELIGQYRLFEKGHDSGNLDPENLDVMKMIKKFKKKKSVGLGEKPYGKLTAGRIQVSRFLKLLEDPLAYKLLEFDDKGIISSMTRNKSVLTHGFETSTLSDISPLKDIYKKLEELLLEEGGEDSENNLEIARSIDFTKL